MPNILPYALAPVLALFLTANSSAQSAQAKTVTWHHDALENALEQATKRPCLTLVYFWANPSAQCAKMFSQTMQTETCVKRMQKLVCVSADTTKAAGNALAKKYGVKTLPTVLFLQPNGAIEDAVLGYCPAQNFNEELDRVARGDRTVTYYRRRAAAAPKDLGLQYELATHLKFVGLQAEHDAICRRIRTADPDGATLTGAYFLYGDLKRSIRQSNQNLAEVDVTPLRRFLQKTAHGAIRWEGHAWIGSLEYERENRTAALRAFRAAWKHCPDGRLLDFSGQIVSSYWKARADLRTAEKKFIVEVAERGVQYAKKLRDADPNDPTRRSYVGNNYPKFLAGRYGALAQAYVMTARYRDALAIVKKCTALDPEETKWKKRLTSLQSKLRGTR